MTKVPKFGDLFFEETNYPLVEFVNYYYQMNFCDFQVKFEKLLDCTLNNKGYVICYDQVMPKWDLAYFAKKEIKFTKELRVGSKTVPYDVEIKTSQTDLVEKLQINDIIIFNRMFLLIK